MRFRPLPAPAVAAAPRETPASSFRTLRAQSSRGRAATSWQCLCVAATDAVSVVRSAVRSASASGGRTCHNAGRQQLFGAHEVERRRRCQHQRHASAVLVGGARRAGRKLQLGRRVGQQRAAAGASVTRHARPTQASPAANAEAEQRRVPPTQVACKLRAHSTRVSGWRRRRQRSHSSDADGSGAHVAGISTLQRAHGGWTTGARKNCYLLFLFFLFFCICQIHCVHFSFLTRIVANSCPVRRPHLAPRTYWTLWRLF